MVRWISARRHMMSTTVTKATMLAAVMVFGTSCVAWQKPVAASVVDDFAPEQTTLSKFFRAVDAVVLVRVETSAPQQYQVGGRIGRVGRLAHQVRVVEVFKTHPQAEAPQIAVLQQAGRIDAGDYVVDYRTAPGAVLRVGQEYVLFLKWNGWIQGFEPHHGVWGTYPVARDGKIVPPARSGFAAQQMGRGREEFLMELRSIAAGGE